uniref:E3 ubiquitin-protein ligase XIAP-like n=1 Tax=Myxine glutinosa TaxID=7769 RepID=UPI00358F0481
MAMENEQEMAEVLEESEVVFGKHCLMMNLQRMENTCMASPRCEIFDIDVMLIIQQMSRYTQNTCRVSLLCADDPAMAMENEQEMAEVLEESEVVFGKHCLMMTLQRMEVMWLRQERAILDQRKNPSKTEELAVTKLTAQGCCTMPVVPPEDLSQEIYRLGRFVSCNEKSPVFIRKLARAGFYPTGVNDTMKCFSCGCEIGNLKDTDEILERHKQASPRCSYVSSVHCTSHEPKVLAEPPKEKVLLQTSQKQVFGAVSGIPTENAGMCSEEARLKTFVSWPRQGKPTIEELAAAGLYYVGTNDRTQCFVCRGILRSWDPLDCALNEHRRWFPSCRFVCGLDVGNIPLVRPNCTWGGGFKEETKSVLIAEGTVTDVTALESTQQEADTRVILHSMYSVQNEEVGRVIIHANDIDVIVKCVYYAATLLKYLPELSRGLPFIHSLSGRGITSYPYFTGKKVWLNRSKTTDISALEDFADEDQGPARITADVINQAKELVVAVYTNKGDNFEGLDLVSAGVRNRVQSGADDLHLGVHQPHAPDKQQFDVRLATFVSWPNKANVSASCLASAGFYYTGVADNVKCFFCDGGLWNWEMGDDPWHEHTKSFPRCGFVLQEKGQAYVTIVQSSSPNLTQVLSQVNSAANTGRDQSTGHQATTCIASSAKKELRRLQDERMCKVCMDQEVSVVFTPCGHLVTCFDCASSASLLKCPICRSVVRGILRTYM